jgi:hypothetical protein
VTSDPLPKKSEDDPYYEDEQWSEYDSAFEDYDDSRWDREVGAQWDTR